MVTEDEPREDAADFVWERFLFEHYATLSANGHVYAKNKIGKQDFAKLEHILVASEGAGATPVLSHFEHNKISVKKLQVVSSIYTALLLALETDSLTTLPGSTGNVVAKWLGMTEIKPPFPRLQVQTYISWHRSQDRDECHEWVRSRLLGGATART